MSLYLVIGIEISALVLEERACLCLESQVYQKAVEDANRIQAGRAEQINVEGQEARATSIKEKFEAGVVTQETEAEKIERLQREKQEELSVFNETGGCKARLPFTALSRAVQQSHYGCDVCCFEADRSQETSPLATLGSKAQPTC